MTALSPDQLISAILRAPVDLLWNGGIGTYVKATGAVAGGRRGPVQRRGPGRRLAAAGQGRRRGRQPRPDPGGPDRVRARRRAGQHRLHRQLGRRRHLRPRGQHQDPAGRGGPRRRAVARRPGRAAARDDRRGRRPGAGAQLPAEPGPGRAPGPRPPQMLHVHARYIRKLERDGRIRRRLDVLPGDKEIAERRSAGTGLTGARVLRPARAHQDRRRRRRCWPPACPTTRTCAGC